MGGGVVSSLAADERARRVDPNGAVEARDLEGGERGGKRRALVRPVGTEYAG